MKDYTHAGKFLSLILRHNPETIGIKLDENGWAKVSELLVGINNKGYKIDMPMLEEIVETNNKKRYSFNDDKTRIRANQGHSIDVDVELRAAVPPDVLYHGTADRFCNDIKKQGLQKQNRNHVHLSADKVTAVAVGTRHGRPVVLSINAKAMYKAGYVFYISENGIWLTADVPPQFINFEEDKSVK